MTLLEKLNLEPDAPITQQQRVSIMDSVAVEWWRFNRLSYRMTTRNSRPLTNAEFLAACEEWLSKKN